MNFRSDFIWRLIKKGKTSSIRESSSQERFSWSVGESLYREFLARENFSCKLFSILRCTVNRSISAQQVSFNHCSADFLEVMICEHARW